VTIVLNGKDHETPAPVSVLALLEILGVVPGQIALELNGRVLRREDFTNSVLRDGDRVEVVRFVGGG
jgi:sulfur carrier protein